MSTSKKFEHLAIDLLELQGGLVARLDEVFGAGDEPIDIITARAASCLGDLPHIVWECCPETFKFSFVSESTRQLLGYEACHWLNDAHFWGQRVVHPDDQRAAKAYCALATAQARDHDFMYRAVAQDGTVHWFHDIVRVVKGERGIPVKLRGIMLLRIASQLNSVSTARL